MSMNRSHSPLRVVFFCGAESPYGFAHLKPLLDQKRFNVMSVVLATPGRWEKFRTSLTGERMLKPEASLSALAKKLRPFSKRPYFIPLFKKLISALKSTQPISKTNLAIEICKQAGVTVWFEPDINAPAFIDKLRTNPPDIILCAAYPQIFKREVIDIPRYGAINSHPSLLPRCRGAHPVFWTITSGEKETGLTLHFMEDTLDTGPIISQIRFQIEEEDTYATIYSKSLHSVPDLIGDLTICFEDEVREALPQDNNRATYFREDRTIHHVIFWSVHSPDTIRNLVRAADGRAFFHYGDDRVFVSKCRISETNRNLTNNVHVPPGTIVDTDDGITVRVMGGIVTFTQWRSESGRKIIFRIGQVLK